MIHRADGAFLLGKRPVGKVYAGWWEFPGGKIHEGESGEAALARELREELAIEVRRAYPWITRVFTYPHATVRLRFFRVAAWDGEPKAIEHQAIAWQQPDAPMVEPMLPANAPVLAALALPWEYAITNAATVGVRAMLECLERRLKEGLRLVQVRELGMPEGERVRFTCAVIELAHRHGAKVLVKSPIAGADGLHVTARELVKLTARPDRPLVAASCHTREELDHAMGLALDFAVLGPVRPTGTKETGLGWQSFAQLARGASIPIYAIGGLARADLEDAWRAGAHGLAMIRGSWS